MLSRSILIVSLIIIAFSSSAQKFNKTKYEKGLRYTAPDSSFNIKFGLRMQNLVQVLAPEDGPAESRTLVRRFRLKFDGYILSPRLVYKMEIGQSNLDVKRAGNLLLDAVIKYNATGNLWIWFGQTKLPGNRERVNSSQQLEFVDRSLVNSRYNIDRDVALQFHHSFNLGGVLIREAAAISGGEGRNYSVANAGGYDYTGRIEVLPFGKFTKKGDYFQADLHHEKTPKLAFGATVDHNVDASQSRGQLGSELAFNRSLSSIMLDMIFKYKGFSVMSEFIRKDSKDPFGNAEKAQDSKIEGTFVTGNGFTGQMSYVTKNHWGLAGRFTNITPDKATFLPEENQYSLSLSRYLVKHKFKIQTDASYNTYYGAAANSFMWRFHIEVGI